MKSKLTKVLWSITAIVTSIVLVAFGFFIKDFILPPHEHTYEDYYTITETNHFYPASCCENTWYVTDHYDNNEDGMCDLCNYGAQAVINGVGYLDIYEAIENAEADSTIILFDDLDLVKDIRIDKKLTIDLNGHTIKRNSTNTQTILVLQNGDLTIIGEGTIDGCSNQGGDIAIWAYGGKVTINNGTYTNIGAGENDHYDLIYASNGGEIIINGGLFKGQTPAWILNLLDADRNNSSISVKGGTFINLDPSNSKAEGVGTNFVADGYKVITEVQENEDIHYIVTIEE